MARLVNSNEEIFNCDGMVIPVNCYCIESDNYNEAYALARELYEADLRESMARTRDRDNSHTESFDEWFARMNSRRY